MRGIGEGRTVRQRCDISARLEPDEGEPIALKVIDLSETGAFVATTADLQVGDTGRLAIGLPGGEPFRTRVTVVRLGVGQLEVKHPRLEHVTVARMGVGVRFEEVPAEELPRLRDFLELLDER